MEFLVLGAGVIGVTTAWYLRAQGHDVRVVERQAGPALEASYANAGHVSGGVSEPWANPQTPSLLPKWLLQDDAPLVWRPRARADQWRWLLRFLRECSAERYGRNLVHLASLGVYSRNALQALRRELGLAYDHHEGGILSFHCDPAQFERASAAARRWAVRGIEREVKTRDECLAIEPALQPLRDRIVGGVHSARDETGDAQQFTEALARVCVQRGVAFDYGTRIGRIVVEGDRVQGVEIERERGQRETLRADACVVALGCATPAMLEPLGVGDIAIYPVKGYSVTVPVANEALAFRIGLHDVSRKMAFSRLGNRLRGTSTAEIGDFDVTIDERRCRALVDRIDAMTPGAGRSQDARYWAGLRPMTPSNVPYVGRLRMRNLYINAGHGTVGWTQACGSAKALAEIVGGRRPELDFPFLGIG